MSVPLATEKRETPRLPFGMTAEEVLDACCPAPRRHHLDEQGEPAARPGLTLRQTRALRIYRTLLDALCGKSIRLSPYEADLLLELLDIELNASDEARGGVR